MLGLLLAPPLSFVPRLSAWRKHQIWLNKGILRSLRRVSLDPIGLQLFPVRYRMLLETAPLRFFRSFDGASTVGYVYRILVP